MRRWKWSMTALLVTGVLVLAGAPAEASSDAVRLMIDGQLVVQDPSPVIQNGRTLVPVRLVSEKLGTEVHWDGQQRSVTLNKDGQTVRMITGNRLIGYRDTGEQWQVADVAPQIISDRTFVPLRLVANALGVFVDWDPGTKTVSLDSSINTDRMSFGDLRFTSLENGRIIQGAIPLNISGPAGLPSEARETRYLLIDPKTHKGTVIARVEGTNPAANWAPQPFENGKKLLGAVVYGSGGRFLSGTVVSVDVNITPRVTLEGVSAGERVSGPVVLHVNTNFPPGAVQFEIQSSSGSPVLTGKRDPQAPFRFVPQLEQTGTVGIRAIAYDSQGQAYHGPLVEITAVPDRYLNLSGVSSGQRLDGPVTLRAERNFQVTGAQFIWRQDSSGRETVIGQTDGGPLNWFAPPAFQGSGRLFVRVQQGDGTAHESPPVAVTVAGTPRLVLSGVGPGQVLSAPVTLGVRSNLNLSRVRFIRINPRTGSRLLLGETFGAGDTLTIDPGQWGAGAFQIRAEGTYGSARTISSESISLSVYTGRLYSARPVIAKDRFLPFAASMALESQKQTGMSAALQTAQAILETGWGQSVPVDKYTGQFSRNLFGIKGSGPAGSVVSNTWEEYNGTVFRVDARFRAYHSIQQSWDDHKQLLLTAQRYAPYRDVMHDGVQGAWALRRAGYATDSQYPVKLINIMEQYDLFRLDQVDI